MSKISNTNTKFLNQVQTSVYNILKNEDFEKSGRTFNKTIDENIIHVINFQIGQKDLAGHFTINLGVYVKELDENNQVGSKKIFHDYDCSIRVRLSELTTELNHWLKIDRNIEDISQSIIGVLMNEGKSWFGLFNSKENLINNLQIDKIGYFKNRNRAKLDAAILQLNYNNTNATKLFNEYYDNIDKDNSAHKIYVASLANKFGLKINNVPKNTSTNLIDRLLNE
tara:strand:+ start:1091 stop:1765 length:675 start_codon:yes stop_codon:yes gene_type:complete